MLFWVVDFVDDFVVVVASVVVVVLRIPVDANAVNCCLILLLLMMCLVF